MSVGESDDGAQFGASAASDAIFQAACNAAKGFYCINGASIEVDWESNVTKSSYSMLGVVVGVPMSPKALSRP